MRSTHGHVRRWNWAWPRNINECNFEPPEPGEQSAEVDIAGFGAPLQRGFVIAPTEKSQCRYAGCQKTYGASRPRGRRAERPQKLREMGLVQTRVTLPA